MPALASAKGGASLGQRDAVTAAPYERGGRAGSRSSVWLLDADPDLACNLRPQELDHATRHAVAVGRQLPEGAWAPSGLVSKPRATTMLFVLDGLLLHEVSVANRRSAELIGTGDVIHPWSVDPTSSFPDGRWTVLRQTEVAVLDDRFLHGIARWPALGAELVSRAGRRGQVLAAQTMAVQARRVDERILLVFSLLASRWGRVSSNGIVLPVSLSHALIGRLVGARRPSVSVALGELRRRGALVPLGREGWLLDDLADASCTSTFRVRADASGAPVEAAILAGGGG